MVGDIIDLCTKEIKKPNVQQKINDDIIEPLVSVVLDKIKPFVFWSIIFLFLTLSIMICILFIVIFK